MCRIAIVSLVLLHASCASPNTEPPTLETLDGTNWLLRSWDGEEPVTAEPPVTLTYTEGRFAGRSGCNNYSGSVEPGEQTGTIAVAPIISTRMACPEMDMQVETRYLRNLQGATKFDITGGELLLTYQDEAGQQHTMIFTPHTPGDSRP